MVQFWLRVDLQFNDLQSTLGIKSASLFVMLLKLIPFLECAYEQKQFGAQYRLFYSDFPFAAPFSLQYVETPYIDA